MPVATILSIGDELTLGQTLDTNSAWLSDQLAARSILPREHRTVSDDRPAIAAAIAQLAHDSDLLLITGGLGPTADDLTREALGDVISPGQPLVLDESALADIKALFARRTRTMPAMNRRQAFRPAAARLLPNPLGTAPGLAATLGRCLIFSMPGPPPEMHRMFFDHVLPAAQSLTGDQIFATAAVHECGLGESAAAELLGSLMDRTANPLIGTTASQNIVSARIRAAGSADLAAGLVDSAAQQVQRAWFPYAFGRDHVSLPESLGVLLKSRNLTLATAESCSGGWLGKMIVDVPGSSDYYAGGFITYSNVLKQRVLAVHESSLATHGAVSAHVAAEMASGALRAASAHCALSITGIAGPGGETPGKPVGTVFIAAACAGSSSIPSFPRRRESSDDADNPISVPAALSVRRFTFPGDRLAIRDRACKSALQMLRFLLLDVPDSTTLLWQTGKPLRFPLSAPASSSTSTSSS